MIRFVVDAQLPPVLAEWLAEVGHKAEHVRNLKMAAARDEAIWEYAAKAGAAIITKDEDFAWLRRASVNGPQVVWIRWPNTRRVQLLTRFAAAFPKVLAALESGEALLEVR